MSSEGGITVRRRVSRSANRLSANSRLQSEELACRSKYAFPCGFSEQADLRSERVSPCSRNWLSSGRQASRVGALDSRRAARLADYICYPLMISYTTCLSPSATLRYCHDVGISISGVHYNATRHPHNQLSPRVWRESPACPMHSSFKT